MNARNTLSFPSWSGKILLILLILGCGSQSSTHVPRNGTVKVKRLARILTPFLHHAAACKYVYGWDECEEYLYRSQIQSLFKDLAPDLIQEKSLNFIMAKELAAKFSDLTLKSSLASPDDTLPGVSYYSPTPYGQPDKLYVEAMGQDSLKKYGRGFFINGKNQNFYNGYPDNLLNHIVCEFDETLHFESGNIVEKTLHRLSFGYEAKDFSCQVLLYTLEGAELSRFMQTPLNHTPSENPDELAINSMAAPWYAFEKLTLQSAYEQDLLFLDPVRVNGAPVEEESRRFLLEAGIKGPQWQESPIANFTLIMQVNEPQYLFRGINTPEGKEKLLADTYGKKFTLQDYGRNLEMSNGIAKILFDHCMERFSDPDFHPFLPDYVQGKWTRIEDKDTLRSFIREVEDRNGTDLGVWIELFQPMNLQNEEMQVLPPQKIRFTLVPKLYPPRNVFMVEVAEIQEFLQQPRDEWGISYLDLLEKHAFKTIFNVNGQGAKTMVEAKSLMETYHPLYPQPIPEIP